MKSYDLLIHKEIVRLLKAVKIVVREDSLGANTPVVVISETSEIEDKSKTFDRNSVRFTLNMWGSKNGSSIEVKELKAKVVEVLTTGAYNIPNYSIDLITVEDIITFKELDNAKNSNNVHYFQSVLTINYKIKEDN